MLAEARGVRSTRNRQKHGLLRCAAGATEPQRAQALRVEAVELLVEADRRGAKIDFDDALFAPVRDEPRLAAIRER